MGNFKENYHFPRFQRGSNIFKEGEVQLFPGAQKDSLIETVLLSTYNICFG